jgi:hypothetical protein
MRKQPPEFIAGLFSLECFQQYVQSESLLQVFKQWRGSGGNNHHNHNGDGPKETVSIIEFACLTPCLVFGRTPIHYAASFGYLELVQILLPFIYNIVSPLLQMKKRYITDSEFRILGIKMALLLTFWQPKNGIFI